MTSKLDYLKKYLVAPSSATSDVKASQPALGAVRKKKKKEDQTQSASRADSSLRIRDLSEALPSARAEKSKRTPKDFLASELAGARYDEKPEFVDAEQVEEAQRIDVEKSGVAWTIQQHHKSKAKGQGFVKREPPVGVKREPVVKEEDSDLDLSPPRAAPKASKQKEANRARTRHDSDSDLSPPRPAPPATASKAADGDAPPATSKAADGDANRARTRHDSDSDLSPPRAAPPATASKAADGDANAVRTRHDSDSDLSPPRAAAKGGAARKRHDSDSDVSPPRASGKKQAEEEPEKMSSGLRSGLVRGSDLKEEAAQVRAERRAAVEAAPDEQTGRGAQTVYRNREGKRIEREEWVEQQKKKKKKRAADYPEQELEWGGGLKQRDNGEAEKEELSRIAAQPFARFEPDKKYVEELKAKQDWNDPMRKFEEEEETAASLRKGTDGSAEAEKPKAVQKPKCPHAPWPNRYDIKPGYRWDGKVRGNGFEKKWFEARNAREFKKADAWRKEMAYDDN